MDQKERRMSIFEETMAHMTYVQIEEAAQEGVIILFPVAAIEEHGPHLPLAVDVYGSYLQSTALRSELGKRGIKALIAPPFYWGINISTASFTGSFTCREETVVSVLWDAMASLKRWGLNQVFFINHHLDGHHMQAVDKAIRKARQEIEIQAYWLVDPFIGKRLGFKGNEAHVLLHKSLMPLGLSPLCLNIHAEAYETSFMWSYLPELVDLKVWRTLRPTNLTLQDLEVSRKGGTNAKKITPQGYFGDPTTADPERGRKEIEAYGRIVAETHESFLQGRYSPPEDYHF